MHNALPQRAGKPIIEGEEKSMLDIKYILGGPEEVSAGRAWGG